MSAGRDTRSLLFWNVYMLEVSLALRLGRASTIQQWDITIPRDCDAAGLPDPWGEIMRIWIRHSLILQKIYAQLCVPNVLSVKYY
jgi:hypothetical protein